MPTDSAPQAAPRTFSAAIHAFRTSRRFTGVELARLAGISPRSLSRWERLRGRPRDAEVRKLIATIATMDYPSALELAQILAITPPVDPSPRPPPAPPPPEPVVVAAPPPPPVEEIAPPAPPPIPDDLVTHPIEVAVFRAAETLGISPTPLRPVLSRFLGHVAALGLTAAEAQLKLG